MVLLGVAWLVPGSLLAQNSLDGELAMLVQATEEAIRHGAVRTEGYSDYHRYKEAWKVRHVCDVACYNYIMPGDAGGAQAPASRPSRAPAPSLPAGLIPGATTKQQLIATGITGLLNVLTSPSRSEEPARNLVTRPEAVRQAEEWAARQSAQTESARDAEAAQERARREAEAARLRRELERVRGSARAIADGLAFSEQVAAEGKSDSYLASVFNYAPAVKKSIDTLMDVVSELGGSGTKTVAYSYKAAQDGIDIFNQGQRQTVAGVVTETGSMVTNAAKAADALDGEYAGELKVMGRVVKAAALGTTAAEFAAGEGDWLKALDRGKDIATEFLPKPGKALVAGATGAVKVGVELGEAGQRGAELAQLRAQLDRNAQNQQAKFGARVNELNTRADALEQQLRDLESGRISPAPIAPAGGKGAPLVLPAMPVTVPHTIPASTVVLPPKG